MKLGILLCGYVRENLRDKFQSYPEMFQNLFSSIDESVSFQVYDVVANVYPDQVDDCDAYLITGSRHGAYEDLPWIPNLSSFIRVLDSKRKIMIGICFGHQIIAQALGGRVREQTEIGWGVGISHFNIYQKGLFPDTHQESFSLLMSHKDQVTKLPDDCVVSQGSDFCPIAGFVKNKHIMTFQGHPEFQKDFLKAVMAGRREQIGEQKYQKALISLNEKPDSELVALSILNFIEKGLNRSSG